MKRSPELGVESATCSRLDTHSWAFGGPWRESGIERFVLPQQGRARTFMS